MKESKIKYFKTLLGNFEEAVRIDSWKGGGGPDEIPMKELHLHQTRKQLVNYVARQILRNPGG